MGMIFDSQNVVQSLEAAPDRLRAEIGSYYTGQPNTDEAFKNFNFGIRFNNSENFFVSSLIQLQPNDQVLIPTKRARIFLSGKEDRFRDQDQWSDYIKRTITTGTTFLDHQFESGVLEPERGSVVKNFHNPTYEDFTKIYPSNQLLNYNLISYPHKNKAKNVSRVGDIRTRFDNEDYSVGQTIFLKDLMNQYENRVANYTGSVEELSVKQRHVFDLDNQETEGKSAFLNDFPFYFMKHLDRRATNTDFGFLLRLNGKSKHIMQAVKRDLSFSIRKFRVGTSDVDARIYNFINLMTSTQIVQFFEQEDEIFLLPEGEISNGDTRDRFVNSISAARFINSMRMFIKARARDYIQVINSESSETFFLGYKIEKYIDNDATRPIQTYYTNDDKFIDTQMKYGRKYIYKTKALIGILGSAYSYDQLFMSKDESEMMGEDGLAPANLPIGFDRIAQRKYRAYVDVEIRPSFQILEIEIDSEEATFVDDSPNAPQVYFFNQPHKPHVEFFFSPMYEDREKVDDKVRMEYFNGIYEIYRLDRPPTSMDDFENGFLVSIDDQTTLTSLNPSWSEIPDFSRENMNGYFADRLIPNQKYYYAFKSVTYHGTKSEFSKPFEIEMVKDSDEHKVMVSEYQIQQPKNFVFEQKMKRLMKITPNIERLLFSEEEDTKKWVLDNNSMLAKNQTTKFKIRVTSKHTGKKMDINLNFFLDDRT